jgi:hypothetical protein
MIHTVDYRGPGEVCRRLRKRNDDAGEQEGACDEGLHFVCISKRRYRKKCCRRGNPLSGMCESEMKITGKDRSTVCI